jgi:hypothetical protein
MRETSSHMRWLIDLAMGGMKGTMKKKKQRWGHHALPTGFAKRKCPKDSSYLTISKSTTDHRNMNLG